MLCVLCVSMGSDQNLTLIVIVILLGTSEPSVPLSAPTIRLRRRPVVAILGTQDL